MEIGEGAGMEGGDQGRSVVLAWWGLCLELGGECGSGDGGIGGSYLRFRDVGYVLWVRGRIWEIDDLCAMMWGTFG